MLTTRPPKPLIEPSSEARNTCVVKIVLSSGAQKGLDHPVPFATNPNSSSVHSVKHLVNTSRTEYRVEADMSLLTATCQPALKPMQITTKFEQGV
jgi:hypothetical protein